jgi:hypothetical protein
MRTWKFAVFKIKGRPLFQSVPHIFENLGVCWKLYLKNKRMRCINFAGWNSINGLLQGQEISGMWLWLLLRGWSKLFWKVKHEAMEDRYGGQDDFQLQTNTAKKIGRQNINFKVFSKICELKIKKWIVFYLYDGWWAEYAEITISSFAAWSWCLYKMVNRCKLFSTQRCFFFLLSWLTNSWRCWKRD